MSQTINGIKSLDKLAYDIVCNWPKFIDFDPYYRGVDYSLVIRFYLWDKVGRAIRIQNQLDFGENEKYQYEYNSFPFYHTPMVSQGKFRRKLLRPEKTIFIPFQGNHTRNLVYALKQNRSIRVISKSSFDILETTEVIRPEKINNKGSWHMRLYAAVLESLRTKDIKLTELDKKLLKNQIKGCVLISFLAEKELKRNKPSGLYVHSDNHPPYINYILVARKLGIPTFTYQHGLDCEHYFLDDCFADFVAVWSEDRKKNYLENSIIQPKDYKVIGNYFLEQVKEHNLKITDKTVLFLTRPHRPIKCYSPSRNYLEGKQILEAILKYLEANKDVKLIIKPHPMDLVSLYSESVQNVEYEDRVSISYESVEELFQKVNVVVTEDTTSGAEAMLYKLPCVHVHLAASDPVLPFVKYGAALPGRTKEEIFTSLEKIFSLSDIEKKEMKNGQKKLVNDFIPPGEIHSLTDFISENI
ncbi:hypothetical protein [Christiangramia echinicola]|uniref:CDP-Glycerol:Poly(Glycerophosphate) glycerophosphotransferase n=1 Tax=Christiangramia echinicola TaxID=279359 RepID=A0A1H1L4J6_9FLAO|nr:hypothetical protein [Christiangramia echinicola]SDR69202.1 hypothetical protein SAMN04488552_0541 [Christiangramia echinicola]